MWNRVLIVGGTESHAYSFLRLSDSTTSYPDLLLDNDVVKRDDIDVLELDVKIVAKPVVKSVSSNSSSSKAPDAPVVEAAPSTPMSKVVISASQT
jgi:hypothetical protein